MKKGFIKSQALRLLRTNSWRKTTFEENVKNFRSHLRVRGYPDNLVNKVLAGVKFTDRKSALQQKPQKVQNVLMPFVTQYNPSVPNPKNIRELKQPRRRRQQERHKFAYLTMKNNTFARFARAFFIFGHLADVLDLSTTWNDLFCSCPDDVSMWWQMFNFVSLTLKRWFQFNSRIVWTHVASVMTLSNSEMIAEMRSYIFSLRSCCRRRRVCLNSLI